MEQKKQIRKRIKLNNELKQFIEKIIETKLKITKNTGIVEVKNEKKIKEKVDRIIDFLERMKVDVKTLRIENRNK